MSDRSCQPANNSALLCFMQLRLKFASTIEPGRHFIECRRQRSHFISPLRRHSDSEISLRYSPCRDRQEVDRSGRSEEHTSELQSPCNLVCRLLLEKKKKGTLCL